MRRIADIALAPECYTFRRDTDPDRFFSKVEMDPNSGCWLWSACLATGGYGKFGMSGRILPAHRVSYTNIVGPVPVDRVLDHKCRTRSCVNPAHLRVVDKTTNALENNVSPFAVNAAKSHCPKGHLYTPENTYFSRWTGGITRQCVACRGETNKRMSAERSSAHLAAGGRGAPASRTHCPRGHPLSGENLYVRPDTGARQCKACRRRVSRERYAAAHRLGSGLPTSDRPGADRLDLASC